MIGKFCGHHTTHITVGRRRITPDDTVQSHQSSVFLINTASHTGSGIIRNRRGNQIRPVIRSNICSTGKDTGSLFRFVQPQKASAHHRAGHQIQTTSLESLTVLDDTIAHMCSLRHNGSSTHCLGVSGTGIRFRLTVFQEESVNNCLFGQFRYLQILVSRSIHKGNHMIAVYLLLVQSRFFHRAQTCLHQHWIARRKVLAVTAFQNNSFGHHISIALRIIGLTQCVGMIYKRILCRIVSGHPHINLSLGCCGRQFSGSQQNLLQFHGTGRIVCRSAASQSFTILGYMIHILARASLTDGSITDISFILTLEGSHINGTVLDTVRILCVIVRNDHSFDIVGTGIDGRGTALQMEFIILLVYKERIGTDIVSALISDVAIFQQFILLKRNDSVILHSPAHITEMNVDVLRSYRIGIVILTVSVLSGHIETDNLLMHIIFSNSFWRMISYLIIITIIIYDDGIVDSGCTVNKHSSTDHIRATCPTGIGFVVHNRIVIKVTTDLTGTGSHSHRVKIYLQSRIQTPRVQRIIGNDGIVNSSLMQNTGFYNIIIIIVSVLYMIQHIKSATIGESRLVSTTVMNSIHFHTVFQNLTVLDHTTMTINSSSGSMLSS